MISNNKSGSNPNPTNKPLTKSQARSLDQKPYKPAKCDKDILHDSDKQKLMPDDDGSLSIISTHRKRVRKAVTITTEIVIETEKV